MHVFSKKNLYQLVKNWPIEVILLPFLVAVAFVFLCSYCLYHGEVVSTSPSADSTSLHILLFSFCLLSAYALTSMIFLKWKLKISFFHLKDSDELFIFSVFISFVLSPLFFITAEHLVKQKDLITPDLLSERFVEIIFVVLGCSLVCLLFQLVDVFAHKNKTTTKNVPTKIAPTPLNHSVANTYPLWEEIKKKAIYLRRLPITSQEVVEIEKVIAMSFQSIEIYESLYTPSTFSLAELEKNLHFGNVFLDRLIEKYNEKQLKPLKKYQEKLKQLAEKIN